VTHSKERPDPEHIVVSKESTPHPEGEVEDERTVKARGENMTKDKKSEQKGTEEKGGLGWRKRRSLTQLLS
jgi:hypothetical protein